MGKKDFSALDTRNVFAETIENAAAEPIQEPIQRQSRDTMPTAEIVEQARQQGRTQGRKGCKAHRFNMAFSEKSYLFITTMARVRGETVTSFVNHILEQAADDNAELFQQALKFRDSL